ncbi:MAG: ABC transporter permease [Acidimicrobiia bacterium]
MIRDDGPGSRLDMDAIMEASVAAGEVAVEDLRDDEIVEGPPRSPFKIAMRRFGKHRLASVSVFFIGLLGLVAVLAPFVAPSDPNAVDLMALRSPPSADHLLGTDSSGRDVLSRIIFGARVSLTVGVAAAISAAGLGTVLGLIAGFTRGVVDTVIMRIVDIFLSFPSLIVILLLVAILGPSVLTIVLVIAFFEWPTSCRIVRQMTLTLREHGFVVAARANGASSFRIMRRHIVSGVISPLTVVTTLLSAQAILLEASLSFLGLGVRQPQASWGGMLNEAQSVTVLEGLPWLWLPPGIAIAATVLAINFIGDGLRDAFDPRLTR